MKNNFMKIIEKCDIVLHFLQLFLMSGLVICFCIQCVVIYCLAEIYEDNPTLYRPAVGKERSIFIFFLGSHSLILQ